jgi:integral membrane protein (TIGR01906 family)
MPAGYASRMRTRTELASAVVAGIATPVVIIGVSVLLFLNPLWVGFEQGRSDVTAWTGYSRAQVDQVTGSILSDLVFGPPRFAVQVNGVQVLDPREVSHMADVRSVMMTLGALALLALVALVAAAATNGRKRAFWEGIRLGSGVLIAGVFVIGAAFAVFFDQMFLIFHDIFFAPGTFAFDPSKEKLVQLFPDQFWSDTSMALAGAVLVLAVGTHLAARRRLRRSIEVPQGAASPAAEVVR